MRGCCAFPALGSTQKAHKQRCSAQFRVGAKKIIDSNYSGWQNTRISRWQTFQPGRQQNQSPNPRSNFSVMNKAELVDSVAKTLGNGSRAEAERAVNAVIDSIKSGIRKDKSVQLVGFGTFRVAERAARMGINPKTGEKIKIKKSKTVKFAVGKELKGRL